MEFLEPVLLPIITLVAVILMFVMIDRGESRYRLKHMGYSKDEWEAFTIHYDYTPQQVQNICTHLDREWPKSEQEMDSLLEEVYLHLAEADVCSCEEDFLAYCDLVIEGKGKGYWEPSDEDYESVTPPRLGNWVTADTSTEKEIRQ